MRIIEKRAKFLEGGFGPDVAIAEITFDDGTHFYGEWSQESGDDILYVASEESIYDLAEDIRQAEEEGVDWVADDLIAKRDALFSNSLLMDDKLEADLKEMIESMIQDIL